MSEASTDSIALDIEGGIATVTLNRPQVRNSIDLATARRLSEVVEQIERDPQVRVGIITGAGGIAFCAGADLQARARGEARASFPPHGFAGFVRRQRSKPFIAAVNGYAVGGGLEIAMACELVVAAPNAVFSLPEPLRGLIAGGDCLPSVLSRLPKAIAWDMALTCRRLSADEALLYGMVNAVSPQVLDAAKAMARRVVAGAPGAITGTMRLLQALLAATPAGYDELTESTQGRLFATEDAQEGSRAFLEKREPVWTGA
ncbi:MAG: enoyl-CoA hydratase-related protein [Pseudomonadota bacterium]